MLQTLGAARLSSIPRDSPVPGAGGTQRVGFGQTGTGLLVKSAVPISLPPFAGSLPAFSWLRGQRDPQGDGDRVSLCPHPSQPCSLSQDSMFPPPELVRSVMEQEVMDGESPGGVSDTSPPSR